MPVNPTKKKSLKDTKGKTPPLTYIGGTPQQTRATFWDNYPEAVHVTDSIANAYSINPALLRNRLAAEGYVDRVIEVNNSKLYDRNTMVNDYIYGNKAGSGYARYGLDNVPAMIETGFVKPINEHWKMVTGVNEKGNAVYPAEGNTNLDNMGLMAATLKALRDKAKKDFPNANNADLDRYAQAYYNRGAVGGKKWVKNGAKGYKLIYK